MYPQAGVMMDGSMGGPMGEGMGGAMMMEPSSPEQQRRMLAEMHGWELPPERPEDVVTDFDRVEPIYQARNRMLWEMRRLLADVTEQGRRLAAFWRSDLTDTPDDDWLISLPILDTFRQKARAILSGATVRVNVSSYSPGQGGERRGDLCEAFARLYRDRRDVEFRRGGNGSGFEDAIRDAALVDGHVYEYLVPDPGRGEMPLRAQLWDATEVYPVWRDGRMARCFRRFSTKAEELKEQYPRADWSRIEDDQDVEVLCWYNRDWMAVVRVDCLEWLLPPTPHLLGRVPVIASFYRGIGFSRMGMGTQDADQTELVRGVPAFWHVRSLIEALQRLYSAAIDQTTRAARGKFVTKLPPDYHETNAPPPSIDDAPGTATVPAQTQIEQVYNRAAMPALEAMIQRLLKDLYDNLWTLEGGQRHEVALERIVATREQLQFFQPYYDGVDRHLEDELETALGMWRRMRGSFPEVFGPLMVLGRSGRGKDYFEPMDWQHVPEQLSVRVKTRTATDVEQLQKGQVAASLKMAGLVSTRYIATEWLDVEDFDEMERQIEEDAARSSPATQEVMAVVLGVRQLRRELEEAEMAGDELIASIVRSGLDGLVQQFGKPPQAPPPPPPGGGGIPPELAGMVMQQGGAGPMGPAPVDSGGQANWVAAGVPPVNSELMMAQQLAGVPGVV